MRGMGLGWLTGADEGTTELKRRAEIAIGIERYKQATLEKLRGPAKKTGGDASEEASARATTALTKATKELDQIGLTPLGKTISDINARFVTMGEVGKAALKGEALAAFNVRLDETKAKLVGIAQMESGKAEVGKFEQQFDVKFEFTNKQAAQDIAQNFVGVFNQFKNNPAAKTTITKAFNSLVTQGIKEGVPDIPELLKSLGVSDDAMLTLTASLPQDLQVALEATYKTGQQWGDKMKTETAAVKESFSAIGTELDIVRAHADEVAVLNTKIGEAALSIAPGFAAADAQAMALDRTLGGILGKVQAINANPIHVIP